MELIPSRRVSDDLQLVLRTKQHLVVYDTLSREVAVRPNEAGPHRAAVPDSKCLAVKQEGASFQTAPQSLQSCPFCRRPWSASIPQQTPLYSHSDWMHESNEDVLVAPHYFRLLSQASTRTDDESNGESIGQETNEGYYERFFIEIRQLGRGSRGTVFLCQHVLHGHALGTYAVKKIPVGDRCDVLSQSLGEVHLMEELIHPNVIHYKHAWIEMAQLSLFAPRVPTLHVLMMAANGGSLSDWIAARSGTISSNEELLSTPRTYVERLKAEFRERRHSTEKNNLGTPSSRTGMHFLREDEIVQLMKDITYGLDFLHDRGILHLDLKPGNVLLHWDEDALFPKALLSDFGSSLPLHENWARKRTGNTGTMEYMAPEAVVSHEGQLAELSSKADIWSLGILLYMLIFFDLPYTQVDDIDQLREEISAYTTLQAAIQNRGLSRRFALVHPALTLLLAQMLQIQPEKRPSCRNILNVLERYPDISGASTALSANATSALSPHVYTPHTSSALSNSTASSSQTLAPSLQAPSSRSLTVNALSSSPFPKPRSYAMTDPQTTTSSRKVGYAMQTTLLVPLVVVIAYAQTVVVDRICTWHGSYHAWIRYLCTFLALLQVAFWYVYIENSHFSTSSRPIIWHAVDMRLVLPCAFLALVLLMPACSLTTQFQN